jgi:hypothetical protein
MVDAVASAAGDVDRFDIIHEHRGQYRCPGCGTALVYLRSLTRGSPNSWAVDTWTHRPMTCLTAPVPAALATNP